MRKIQVDALVVGGGISGMQTALDLADQGYQVALVEKEASIGGKMIALSKVFPTLDCCSCITTPKMSAVGNQFFQRNVGQFLVNNTEHTILFHLANFSDFHENHVWFFNNRFWLSTSGRQFQIGNPGHSQNLIYVLYSISPYILGFPI